MPRFESGLTQGVVISGSFLYRHQKTAAESNSSTSNSAGEELNGSNSSVNSYSNDFAAKVDLMAKYFLDRKLRHHISFGGNLGYDGTRGNSKESSIIRFKVRADERSLLYTDKTDGMQLNVYLKYRAGLSPDWDIHSTVSAAFNTSKDNRDAENAEDNRWNGYYSRNSKDRGLNLKQTVAATCAIELGQQKYFNTSFGMGIYEDNIAHFSNAFGTVANNNDFWKVNAGPDVMLSYRDKLWQYTLRTGGKSMTPAQNAVKNTTLDVSNPIDVSTGNIYLKTGYHQDINLSVICRARNKGSYVNMSLTGSADMNEITRASWYDPTGVRYSIPVNSKRPRYNASLNVTSIQPLNKKKSLNLTIMPKGFFGAGSTYVTEKPLSGMDKFNYAELMKWLYGDSHGSEFYSGKSGFIENSINSWNWVMNVELKYELAAYSIRCGASVDNSRIKYSAFLASLLNTWRYRGYAEVLWQNKTGWEIEGRFDFNGYSGFSDGYNRPDYLLNLKLAKTIKSFTATISAYDILGTSKSFSHIVSAEYVEDMYRNNIGRCVMIGLSYNFGKWNFAKKNKFEALEKSNNL